MSDSKPKSDFKFSEALAELESITAYLESSSVDLDEAIKKFERGQWLTRQLEEHLKTAENTIKTIKVDKS